MRGVCRRRWDRRGWFARGGRGSVSHRSERGSPEGRTVWTTQTPKHDAQYGGRFHDGPSWGSKRCIGEDPKCRLASAQGLIDSVVRASRPPPPPPPHPRMFPRTKQLVKTFLGRRVLQNLRHVPVASARDPSRKTRLEKLSSEMIITPRRIDSRPRTDMVDASCGG